MTDDGQEYFTHYGIHGYRMAGDWIAEGLRKGSLGCVVLQEKHLDIVQNAFVKNSGELYVQTAYGTGRELVARINWMLSHPEISQESSIDDGIGS